jgi:hypothetical protein
MEGLADEVHNSSKPYEVYLGGICDGGGLQARPGRISLDELEACVPSQPIPK